MDNSKSRSMEDMSRSGGQLVQKRKHGQEHDQVLGREEGPERDHAHRETQLHEADRSKR